jgi:hypothetical protein
MRALVIVCAALFLSGCTGWQGLANQSIQNQGDKQAAIEAQVACMKQKADELDDGQSDAVSIAYAVAGACNAESTRVINDMTGTWWPENVVLQFQNNMRQKFVQVATQVVLEERRRK